MWVLSQKKQRRTTSDNSGENHKLDRLINAKDAQILELTERVKLLETTVNIIKEGIEELKKDTNVSQGSSKKEDIKESEKEAKKTSIKEDIEDQAEKMVRKCKKCGQDFSSKKELAAHLRSQHAEYVKALLEVKAQKERKVVDKRDDGTLPKIVSSLRCDQCHFGGMDDNDLKKHKNIHQKVEGTTIAWMFSGSEL